MSTDKLQVFKQLPFLAAVTNCTEQADAMIDAITRQIRAITRVNMFCVGLFRKTICKR